MADAARWQAILCHNMKKEDIVQAIVDFGQPAVERMGTRHMLRALHEVEAEQFKDAFPGNDRAEKERWSQRLHHRLKQLVKAAFNRGDTVEETNAAAGDTLQQEDEIDESVKDRLVALTAASKAAAAAGTTIASLTRGLSARLSTPELDNVKLNHIIRDMTTVEDLTLRALESLQGMQRGVDAAERAEAERREEAAAKEREAAQVLTTPPRLATMTWHRPRNAQRLAC